MKINPFCRLYGELAAIRETQEKIMAAIDDLNAAIAALQTEVTAIGTQMDTLLADLNAALAANNTAGIEAAVTALSQQTAALAAAGTRDMPPATA
jgi:uncharacterized coiled-coil protein SlyX